MPELTRDDFQGALNDSLVAEQTQRQTELLEEGLSPQAQADPATGAGSVGPASSVQAVEGLATPMLDKLDTVAQAQDKVSDQFGEVGDQIISLQADQESMTADKIDEILSADVDFLADKFDQMVETEDMTKDQIMNLASEMQKSLEDQEAGALAGDFTEKLTPLIDSIEEETGEPLTDVRSALVNASGQMGIGDLLANKFEILKNKTVDSLGALKDSFMSGLGTLKDGLMGVFEGGQSILGLFTSALSGVFATFGPMIGTWVAGAFSWSAVGSTLASAIGSILLSPITAVAGALASITGLANWFTGGAFSEEARSAIEGVPVLGTLYGMLDYLGVVGDLLQAIVDPIAFTGSMLGKGIGFLVADLVPGISSALMDGLGWLADNVVGVIQEVPGLIMTGLETYLQAITTIPSALLGAVESALRMVGMDSVANGVGALQEAITNLPNTIMSALKQLPGMITKAVQVIPGKITKAIYELPSMIWNKMKQIPSMLANAVSEIMPGAEDIPGAETASNIASGAGDMVSSLGSAIGFAEGGVLREPTVGVGMESGQVKTFAEEGPEVIVPTAQASDGTPPDTSGGTEQTAQQGAPESSEVMLSGAFSQGDGDGSGRNEEKIQWLQKIYKAIQGIAPSTGDNANSVPSGLTDTQALRISQGVL